MLLNRVWTVFQGTIVCVFACFLVQCISVSLWHFISIVVGLWVSIVSVAAVVCKGRWVVHVL